MKKRIFLFLLSFSFFLTITSPSYALQKGIIAVTPTEIEPGKSITISGIGLIPNLELDLSVTGGSCLGGSTCGAKHFVQTNKVGNFSAQTYATWPADKAGTIYKVKVMYGGEDISNEVEVTMTQGPAAPGTLNPGDDCTYNPTGCPSYSKCEPDYSYSSPGNRSVCGGRSAGIEATCDKTTPLDKIGPCIPSTDRLSVQRCGPSLTGFNCPDNSKQRFCMNGSTDEKNVVCEVIPPFPPPCSKWVNQLGKEISKEFVATTVVKKCAEVVTGLSETLPISTDPARFVKSIFGIILSLSGGIALLLIILSGYKLMLSQGNPEKAQEAKETLTAAIVGLLFIIFSLVILQVIGVDILRLPDFRK